MKQLPISMKILLVFSALFFACILSLLVFGMFTPETNTITKPVMSSNAAEKTKDNIGIMRPIEREDVVSRLYYDSNTEAVYVYMETEGVYDHSNALSPYYAYNGEILHYCPHDNYFYVFTNENERLQANLFAECE